MKINVKVKTNSSPPSGGPRVIKTGEIYELYLKSSPIEGRANKEIINLLADYFDVPKSLIKISKGLKSKNKIIEIIY